MLGRWSRALKVGLVGMPRLATSKDSDVIRCDVKYLVLTLPCFKSWSVIGNDRKAGFARRAGNLPRNVGKSTLYNTLRVPAGSMSSL